MRNSQDFHGDLGTSCLITLDAVFETDLLKGVSRVKQRSSEIRSSNFEISVFLQQRGILTDMDWNCSRCFAIKFSLVGSLFWIACRTLFLPWFLLYIKI